MSPTLIKELCHPGDCRGPNVQYDVQGNINLIEDDGVLHAFFDARQRKYTLELLRKLNGSKGEITAIESIHSQGKLFYTPSNKLKNTLITSRESAVEIEQNLVWNVHIGRKNFSHRIYYRGGKTPQGLPATDIRLYPNRSRPQR